MPPSTRSAALAAATSPAANPRKRRQSSPSTAAPAPQAALQRDSLGTLAFDDEGDHDDGDVLAASSDDDDDTAALEAFPELDLAASDNNDDDDDDSFDGSVGSGDEEDDDDDEAQLRAELEDEQNEILSDNDDDDDDDTDDDTSDLDELIRRNTFKPDEGVAEASSIPGQNAAIGERDGHNDLPLDYMRRSRTVKSKLTGKAKTQWDDDIEPDYASDSSTEEVRPSRRRSPLPRERAPADAHPRSFSCAGRQPRRQHPVLLVRRPAAHRLRHRRQEGHAPGDRRRARPLPRGRRGRRRHVDDRHRQAAQEGRPAHAGGARAHPAPRQGREPRRRLRPVRLALPLLVRPRARTLH